MNHLEDRDWTKEQIVSIDFDGVLAEYDGFKGETIVGKPIVGAKEFLALILSKGFKPIVLTTRSVEVIKNWLKENNFPDLEVSNIKLPSVVYIDDRCVKFDGDYKKLMQDLNGFNVYWRVKESKIFEV